MYTNKDNEFVDIETSFPTEDGKNMSKQNIISRNDHNENDEEMQDSPNNDNFSTMDERN